MRIERWPQGLYPRTDVHGGSRSSDFFTFRASQFLILSLLCSLLEVSSLRPPSFLSAFLLSSLNPEAHFDAIFPGPMESRGSFGPSPCRLAHYNLPNPAPVQAPKYSCCSYRSVSKFLKPLALFTPSLDYLTPLSDHTQRALPSVLCSSEGPMQSFQFLCFCAFLPPPQEKN